MFTIHVRVFAEHLAYTTYTSSTYSHTSSRHVRDRIFQSLTKKVKKSNHIFIKHQNQALFVFRVVNFDLLIITKEVFTIIKHVCMCTYTYIVNWHTLAPQSCPSLFFLALTNSPNSFGKFFFLVQALLLSLLTSLSLSAYHKLSTLVKSTVKYHSTVWMHGGYDY